jgi:hypothetical protein
MGAAARQPETGLKRLAATLAFVCLVLVLMAFEQSHTMAAWRTVREETLPAAGRMLGWATDGGADGLSEAAAGSEDPRLAAPGHGLLAGEFVPADDATRRAAGNLTFVGAALHFGTGDTLHTTPLRIAVAREGFAHGQTFAGRLDAVPDAQIELRRVTARPGAPTLGPSPLCGGQPAGVVALLHRRDRVDVMVFRARTIVGPDAPVDALCGSWSFRRR